MTIQRMKQLREEGCYTCEDFSEVLGLPIDTVQKMVEDRVAVCESVAEFYGSEEHVQESYTVEDYLALPDDIRYELIDGELIRMDAPTYTHQYAAGEIYNQISNYIKKKGGKCVPLMSPIDVQLDCDNRTMIQPDVIIVCNREERFKNGKIFGAPDFVLEVVSPSSRRKDYIKKLGKYQAAGVREYWLLDPKDKTLIVYYFEGEDCPGIYGFEDPVPMNIYDGELVVDLTSIAQWVREMEEE